MNIFLSSPVASKANNGNDVLSSSAKSEGLTRSQILRLSSVSLETHIGGVLVLTEENNVLYATESLESRLQALTGPNSEKATIPPEINLICQVLKQSRTRFPHQNWAIEFDIFTKDAIALRIRSRWLKLEGFGKPCILLIVEDRQQLVQDMVLDEVQDWGLTPREQEVWLLHRDGHTYNQIAEKLFITINTVKKHMRSVHAKRRAQSTGSVSE
jgi:DNA-binding CsgD family transcriptional regulator